MFVLIWTSKECCPWTCEFFCLDVIILVVLCLIFNDIEAQKFVHCLILSYLLYNIVVQYSWQSSRLWKILFPCGSQELYGFWTLDHGSSSRGLNVLVLTRRIIIHSGKSIMSNFSCDVNCCYLGKERCCKHLQNCLLFMINKEKQELQNLL